VDALAEGIMKPATSVPAIDRPPAIAPRTRRGVAEGALWFGALALLWAIFNPSDRKSWIVGLPCVAAAAFLAWKIHSPLASRVSLQGMVRFLCFFLRQSLAGGWDVAWRALHPRLPLNPGLVHYRLRLPEGPERILLLNITSLLPGTVSAGLEGDTLVLHALETGPEVADGMRQLEARVADLFALDLLIPGELPP
jgi:multicomponent Na+:H+ antiporter subunit E